jgi:tRNA threonylcarbamoyladenosine modification (KEOPS) complex  Pcc1 subunit
MPFKAKMYTAIITLDENIDNIEKLFSYEEKNFANDRAFYNLQRTGDKLEIHATAKDSVALRSALTSITRVLTINEKTDKVLEDE